MSATQHSYTAQVPRSIAVEAGSIAGQFQAFLRSHPVWTALVPGVAIGNVQDTTTEGLGESALLHIHDARQQLLGGVHIAEASPTAPEARVTILYGGTFSSHNPMFDLAMRHLLKTFAAELPNQCAREDQQVPAQQRTL